MICIGRYCIALYRYVAEDRTFGPFTTAEGDQKSRRRGAEIKLMIRSMGRESFP